MESCCGSFNTSGFSSQLEAYVPQAKYGIGAIGNILPPTDHITYAGMFNEMEFEIGQKAKKPLDLHVGFARASNPSSACDKTVNEFLAIFMKGIKDGEPRDQRPLNSVIVLDISGSMGGLLSSKSGESRLSLAKEAIKMFVSKLKPSDSFGLVTFNNQGFVVIKGIKKSELDLENVFAIIDKINVNGGTTLSAGFTQGVNVLNGILENSKSRSECENRLVMITDVCDNSFATTENFISQVSQNHIHTTIIGVSDQFRSDICQSLTKIKGFNYFCAVDTGDLKKYLFENFDWTFFPSSHNIQLKLKSNNVRIFEVFGSPDSEKVSTQYNDFSRKNSEYTITKIPSSFPSELVIENGVVKTVGGLILVKLSPQNHLEKFTGELELQYTTSKGQTLKQIYPLQYNFPKHEQFFSESCLEQAVNGFYYVHQVKQLIESVNRPEERKDPESKQKHISSFEELKKIAPKHKLKDIDLILNILKAAS